MRILITGGLGFLGGRIAQSLIKEGHQVVIGSRVDSSSPDYLLPVDVRKIDWNNESSIINACLGVEVVIHASGMNAKECAENEEQAFLVNAVYTEKIARAARQQKVRKFIFFSTAHVYASPLEGVVNEQSATTNTHPYAISNLAGEEAVLAISDRSSMNSNILRLSNVFGAPLYKSVNCWMLLVNDLCKQAVSKGELVLDSTGDQFRDFVTITDLCCVINEMIKRNRAGQESEVVNVGSGKSCTVYEMAQKVQSCFSKYRNEFCPILAVDKKNNRKIKAFEYQTNFLRKNNYSISGDFEKEIKELIDFCSINFNRKKTNDNNV